jgi:TRAP-type C4-dicarboxylate transport system permease small subunit
MIELITKLDRAFAKVEEVLLALLLVGMVVLAAVQVLLRNIWNTAIDWADISLQNATLLLGLLGAAIATSEGRHLTIDILSRVVKGRSKTLLKVVIGLFCVGMCLLLAKGGLTATKATLAQWSGNIPAGWTAAGTLKQEFFEGSIPQWLSQAMLPVGFLLLAFHFLLRLVRDLATLTSGKEWEKTAAGGARGEAALDELEAKATSEQANGGKGGGA